MGYAMNDPELRRMAMEDSSSGSASDMMMHIWDAAWRNQPRELEEKVKEIIERYEQEMGVNSPGRRLLKFLPLLPALRDAKHPRFREVHKLVK